MHLFSIRRPDGALALCVQQADTLIDLTAAGCPGTLDELLELGDVAGRVAQAQAASKHRYAMNAFTTFEPPLTRPRKALAAGLNYAEHAREANKTAPATPVIFSRYESSWVGHGATLVRPLASRQFDYEGELVAVIGKAGRAIPEARALEHVAGYSIFNDGSVRDYQRMTSQWTLGKNFEASGAFGPCFVDAASLPAGAKGLRLQTRLNGEVVQDANTDDMIFSVAQLIAFCSQAMLLRPGDIIITGTPSGVGAARTPQLFMKAGDICEVSVEGIGVLSNRVEDEKPAG